MKLDHSKKSKIIGISLIFLLILLFVTYIGYSYFLKNNGKEAIKSEFFSKIGNQDLAFFLDSAIYSKIGDKLENGHYESNSNLKIATTMENNMLSKLDLSKFELGHSILRNSDENQSYHKIDIRYSDQPVLTLDGIFNHQQFALKSDEIVNKYVGMNRSNVQNVVNQLGETPIDWSHKIKLKNFLVDRERLDLEKIANPSRLVTYIEIVKEKATADCFSKKENVIVTLNSEQIATTEYTVELDSTKTYEVFEQLAEKLSQDQELFSELVAKKGQDFENENTGILEYSDNENVSQIQGQENNFYTSINIWGENTGAENTQTNSVSNTIENTQISNTTTENTTSIANTIQLNTTAEENNSITQNNDQPQQIEPSEPQEEQQPEQTAEPEQTNSQENSHSTNTTQNNMQEENVRTQGFIAVNEETEGTEEENFIVGENYQETIENIQKLVQKINWSFYLLSGAKANCSEAELKEIWQNRLMEKSKENNRLIVKMYVSEDKVVKLRFELSESQECLDLGILSKSENEKYLLVTVLQGKDDATKGYDISLYKKNDDAVTKTKLNINQIYKNKIRKKTNINLETKGTINSKKYTTTAEIVYSDSDGEFKAELENALNFDVTPEIELLKEENCLLLDTLSEEELLVTKDAIVQKTWEVLREKNRNLNMIDTYHTNSIVQQTEEQNTATEDENARKQAKEVLIQTISEKMTQYLQNGTNLRLQDLEGLTIPNYEVDISISSNLAIITVNGYRFNLDAEFNLSDS